MKYFILTLLFSLPAVADQGSALGTVRDKQLIALEDKINNYCSESHPDLLKEKDSLFLCYLQLQADAKYSDEPLKSFAISIKNEARYIEDNVLALQGNAGQVAKTYIGSEVEKIKDPCKFNPSLAECNIKYTLATKDVCYRMLINPNRPEKICNPSPEMLKRYPVLIDGPPLKVGEREPASSK